LAKVIKQSLSNLTQDRFALCLGLAFVSHAILIFGVVFSAEPPIDRAPKLEITLASFKSDASPKKADFLAQANQKGSGSLEKKSRANDHFCQR
jgi:protein TonB